MKFESCFYEHKSNKAKKLHCYPCLGDLFQCTKLCIYSCLVFCFGIIFTFIWGVVYGSLAFTITYIWSPFIHLFIIGINMATPFISVPFVACLGPLCFCFKRCRQDRKPVWFWWSHAHHSVPFKGSSGFQLSLCHSNRISLSKLQYLYLVLFQLQHCLFLY